MSRNTAILAVLALRSSSTAVICSGRPLTSTSGTPVFQNACFLTRLGNILHAMSLIAALPSDPRELRPLLHAEVDKLGDENLRILHRVALELELEEVTERLNQGFDEDRMTGKLERLPQIIQTARAALRARTAS